MKDESNPPLLIHPSSSILRPFWGAGPARQGFQIGQLRQFLRLAELEEILRLQQGRYLYHARPERTQRRQIGRYIRNQRLLSHRQIAEGRRRIETAAS